MHERAAVRIQLLNDPSRKRQNRPGSIAENRNEKMIFRESSVDSEFTKKRQTQVLRTNILKTINTRVNDSHYKRINADGTLGLSDQTALQNMLKNVTDEQRAALLRIIRMQEASGLPISVHSDIKTLYLSRMQIKEAFDLIAADKTWSDIINKEQFHRLQKLLCQQYGFNLAKTRVQIMEV